MPFHAAFASGQERSNYPLGLSVSDFGDGFALSVQVSGSVGAARVCEHMWASVANVANALALQPQRPARELAAQLALQQEPVAVVPRLASSGRVAHEAPQGVLEHALAALWTELLGVRRVSRHDNFFQLGGDSLLSLKLLLGLRTQVPGGRRLVLADVMKAESLADLAALAAGAVD
jgi:hypothetical protein